MTTASAPPILGRTPNAKEREYMELSHQVPCVVCLEFYGLETPAEFHHIDGKTKPDAHLRGFSLCARHHRIKDNQTPQRWVSRHGDGKKAFEAAYYKESELLAMHKANVDKLKQNMI